MCIQHRNSGVIPACETVISCSLKLPRSATLPAACHLTGAYKMVLLLCSHFACYVLHAVAWCIRSHAVYDRASMLGAKPSPGLMLQKLLQVPGSLHMPASPASLPLLSHLGVPPASNSVCSSKQSQHLGLTHSLLTCHQLLSAQPVNRDVCLLPMLHQTCLYLGFVLLTSKQSHLQLPC